MSYLYVTTKDYVYIVKKIHTMVLLKWSGPPKNIFYKNNLFVAMRKLSSGFQEWVKRGSCSLLPSLTSHNAGERGEHIFRRGKGS